MLPLCDPITRKQILDLYATGKRQADIAGLLLLSLDLVRNILDMKQ